MDRRFGAHPLGAHRSAAVGHDGVVDSILHHRGPVAEAPEPLGVGLVLGKQQLRPAPAGQPIVPEPVMGGAQQPERAIAERP